MENTAACPIVQGTPIFRVLRRIDRRNDTRDPVTASTTRRYRVRFPIEASRGLDSSKESATVAGTTVMSAATRFEVKRAHGMTRAAQVQRNTEGRSDRHPHENAEPVDEHGHEAAPRVPGHDTMLMTHHNSTPARQLSGPSVPGHETQKPMWTS
jgi:hypothetical protein